MVCKKEGRISRILIFQAVDGPFVSKSPKACEGETEGTSSQKGTKFLDRVGRFKRGAVMNAHRARPGTTCRAEGPGDKRGAGNGAETESNPP